MTTNAPEIIRNVSYTQLSVARHYGGCTFQGRDYRYCPVDDTLIRADVLAARKEWRVIRGGENDGPDEWLGGVYRTRAAAMKAARADRSGRLVALWGPSGVVLGLWLKDGEAVQP